MKIKLEILSNLRFKILYNISAVKIRAVTVIGKFFSVIEGSLLHSTIKILWAHWADLLGTQDKARVTVA